MLRNTMQAVAVVTLLAVLMPVGVRAQVEPHDPCLRMFENRGQTLQARLPTCSPCRLGGESVCGASNEQYCSDLPPQDFFTTEDFECVCRVDPSIRVKARPADCRNLRDECTPNPCGGGQRCHDRNKRGTGKDYTCTCIHNGNTATGRPAACSLNECGSNPCGSGQRCTDSNQAWNSKGDFVCSCLTDGSEQRRGGPVHRCPVVECTPNPCGPRQTCGEGDRFVSGDYTCRCDDDRSIVTVGRAANCPVNQCGEGGWCGAGQKCVDLDLFQRDRNYNCECANGVVSHGTPAVCEVDECASGAGSSACGSRQKCEDDNAAANSLGDWYCVCVDDTARRQKAGPANCPLNQCAEGGWCGAGQTCKDLDLLKRDRQYRCTCENGVVSVGAPAVCFVDECTAEDSPCGEGQTCNDPNTNATSLNDFECACEEAKSVTAVGEPAVCEIDECASHTSSSSSSSSSSFGVCGAEGSDCSGRQTCHDPDTSPLSLGDYVCTCSNGRNATGKPANCNGDECQTLPCGRDGTQLCLDRNTSLASLNDFLCFCAEDLTIVQEGKEAVCAFDECTKLQPACGEGELCHDPVKTTAVKEDYACWCPVTREINVGGPVGCPLDECAVEEGQPSPCGVCQTCHDPNHSPLSVGDFVCTCQDGGGNATGAAATCAVIDECACNATLCGTLGDQTCNDPNTSADSLDDYVCRCKELDEEEIGKPAQCTVDECQIEPYVCGDRKEQDCEDQDHRKNVTGDFYCYCKTGFGIAKGKGADCSFFPFPF